MPAFIESLQLACAVCRIGIYTLYKKICCITTEAARPEFYPICLGLSGSGKTTILSLLSGENVEQTEPTSGFTIKAIRFNNCILNIKEIGGGDKVRPFWKHYYRGAQGIVFMVDSASSESDLEEAKSVMHTALSHTDLAGLPCLIIGTFQDKTGARSQEELTEALEAKSACGGRQWTLKTGSIASISNIREAFEVFCNYFTNTSEPDGDDGGYNRI